jgi:hypothetical protein
VVESLGDSLSNVYSKDAIEVLNELVQEPKTENQKQLKEEYDKIQKINKQAVSEETLKNLESLWIFSGRIGCLLDDDLLKNGDLSGEIQNLIGNSTKYLFNNEKLIKFFQAILAKAAEGDKFPEGLKINDEHDNFRKILNNEFKESLQAVLTEVLINNKPLDGIINDYNYVEGDWKYALIKDKSLWKYSYGKFGKHFADEDEVYLYKGTNRNPADIPLKAYSKFLYHNSKHGFPISIEYDKENKCWKVKYNDSTVIDFPFNYNGDDIQSVSV